MFKTLSAIALAATVTTGAAHALPAGYVFDAGPVIDFTDSVEVIEFDSFFPGSVDFAFSGAMTDVFSLDAGFTGAASVDFAGVSEAGMLTNLFFEVANGGTVLLDSGTVVDVSFGDDFLEVLLGGLGGTNASAFAGGFALLTIDLLDTPATTNPWENAIGFESYEISGIIESVAPIPLPAGLWMLLAGLGAAGTLRMRRTAGKRPA